MGGERPDQARRIADVFGDVLPSVTADEAATGGAATGEDATDEAAFDATAFDDAADGVAADGVAADGSAGDVLRRGVRPRESAADAWLRENRPPHYDDH